MQAIQTLINVHGSIISRCFGVEAVWYR